MSSALSCSTLHPRKRVFFYSNNCFPLTPPLHCRHAALGTPRFDYMHDAAFPVHGLPQSRSPSSLVDLDRLRPLHKALGAMLVLGYSKPHYPLPCDE